MNHAVIFVGPSLEREAVDRVLAGRISNVRILPPARQGDFLRILPERPKIIGLIDGFFFKQPAVHFKEILLAIESGVEVLGASSMGALRAAELDVYGMEGIGQVYRMYANGELDGDDEVAVVHAGPEDQYRSLSEALVNIRVTVGAALEHRILDRASASAILVRAKKLHFSQRTYREVTSATERSTIRRLDARKLSLFQEFVRTSRIDQKRLDAIALIETMVSRMAPEPLRADRAKVRVPRTTFLRSFERLYVGRFYGDVHVADHRVWSLQKLMDREFEAKWQRLAMRCLAIDEARERGLHPPLPKQLVEEFKTTYELSSDAELAGWLEGHYMDFSELNQWLQESWLVAALRDQFKNDGRNDTALEYDSWLLRTVADRLGVPADRMLERIAVRPGGTWDEPMVREEKATGNFARAAKHAYDVMIYNRSFERDAPGVLGRLAEQGLESWFAKRWAVSTQQIGAAVHRRGFSNVADFYDIARIGFLFDALEARPHGR